MTTFCLLLQVWEKYDPTAEAAAEKASTSDTKGEVLNVRVTEVVDGSRFYAQIESDTRLQSLEQQLEALKLKEKVLPPGAFAPKRGDLVLGQFTLDDSFARALVVEAPKQQTGSGSDKYEVGTRGSGLSSDEGVHGCIRLTAHQRLESR